MKRSAFIKAAVAVSATIAIPLLYHGSGHKKTRNESLYMPSILGAFCDENEINKIGMEYRSKTPAESNKEQLMKLIFTDKNTNPESLNYSEMNTLLDIRIKEEYSAYKTIVVNGWVISPTEARQCALFSLTRNKEL